MHNEIEYEKLQPVAEQSSGCIHEDKLRDAWIRNENCIGGSCRQQQPRQIEQEPWV
jgi:hypothetical protein